MSEVDRAAMNTVLALTADPEHCDAGLAALWSSVVERGLLAEHAPRIVVQIGQAYRSELVVDTGRSLVRLLHERAANVDVRIIDPGAQLGDWAPERLLDDATDSFAVAAVAAPHGLRVPTLWFDAYHLVTIAAAGPSSYGRVSGILDAQAEPLRRVARGFEPQCGLVYEAHRLAASDLCILCGHTVRRAPDSPLWWLVSNSDVAVTQALARAAGIAPERLPGIRAIARHETLPDVVSLHGSIGRLHGYSAPRIVSDWRGLCSRAAAFVERTRQDATSVRANLHKIPRFVRQRLMRMRSAGRPA